MSKSYGSTVPCFFSYEGIFTRVQEIILKKYPKVSICYKTININATANPKNSICRTYHEELSDIRDLQGVYAVYPTEKENSSVDTKDILFMGCTLGRGEDSLKYFYEYDHKGYIPRLLDVRQTLNVFYTAYKEKGCSYLMRPDEFMNKYSILCIIIDSDFDEDIMSASADLFCYLTVELGYYSGNLIKTIDDTFILKLENIMC